MAILGRFDGVLSVDWRFVLVLKKNRMLRIFGVTGVSGRGRGYLYCFLIGVFVSLGIKYILYEKKDSKVE